MTPEQIVVNIELYAAQLYVKGVPARRMDPSRKFSSLSEGEILAHAHYLCDRTRIRQMAIDPGKWGKLNRHYTAIQMCLSFAGWYTLEQLMAMNRPHTE